MDGARVVRVADRVRLPWKNGRGTTEQIAIGPDGATVQDGFDWRLSVANIEEDGPFSPFPGVDRTLVNLSPTGIDLVAPEGSFALGERFAFASFPGEWAIEGRLRHGPVRDLNVMTRRAACRHAVDVRRVDGPVALGGSPGVAVVLDGRAIFGKKRVLGPGDAVIAAEPLELKATGVILVVSILPA